MKRIALLEEVLFWQYFNLFERLYIKLKDVLITENITNTSVPYLTLLTLKLTRLLAWCMASSQFVTVQS